MKKLLLIIFIAIYGIANAQTTQFWGTAMQGGAYGQGTIFKCNANGNNFHIVYSFDSLTASVPIGSVVLANNGKLYGVTQYGGFNDSCVVYSYEPSTGIFTNVHDFGQYFQFGWEAWSGMMKANDGSLYGLCSRGGVNDLGVIYKIDPVTDTYTNIYDFDSIGGSTPHGSLLQLSNGKLYGMTYEGGTDSSGVIFSFDPSNSTYTKLYDFDGATGAHPFYGNLIQATNLKLYGMTLGGGANNLGVIFSFDLSTGVYTDIYDFDGIHGADPEGSLIQATNGILYGMAIGGPNSGSGVLFSFDIATDSYTDLFDFGGINGELPTRGLTQASNGKLVGTTDNGGTYNHGVAFKYDITNSIYTKLCDFNGPIGVNPNCELVETPILSPANIVEIKNVFDFTINPNPATTYIQLTINTNHNAPLNCEIINVMGEVVFKSQIVNPKSQIKMDVSFLAKGIYVVRVGDGERWENRKLVVE